MAFAGMGPPVTVRQLFALMSTPVLLFVIGVAPVGMIADRRSKSLSLYLASPLTRETYLAAQAAAIFVAVCLVSVGPPLLYLAGNAVIARVGFGDALHVLRLAGKIVLSGALLAASYATLTLAVASFAKRAAAASLALFCLAGILTNVLAAAVTEGVSPYFLLIDPSGLAAELVNRVFGPDRYLPRADYYGVAGYVVALAAIAWTLLALGAAWFRYHRLVVSR